MSIYDSMLLCYSYQVYHTSAFGCVMNGTTTVWVSYQKDYCFHNCCVFSSSIVVVGWLGTELHFFRDGSIKFLWHNEFIVYTNNI